MNGLALLAGSAHPALAEGVAKALGEPPVARAVERFPDGELHVELNETVCGRDVYVLQSMPSAPDAHLMELLQLTDAAKRDGARRVTAVFPYFAYARQDRRAKGRESVAAKLVADLVAAAGVDRALVLDPHSTALEGFFRIPYASVTAAAVLAEALRPLATRDTVIVAPDLGAARLAARFASILGLTAAHVHKTREGPKAVAVQRIAGDVRGRTPILVDDMISTGGTLAAAARALEAAGASPVIAAAATHGLFAGPATQVLREAPIREFVVTDSVPPVTVGLKVRQVGVDVLLAEAIRRLHQDRPLDELALRG